MRFQFPNELERECEGHESSLVGQIVSHLKVNKMIAKGYLCHLVRVNDLDQDVPSIVLVSTVNEFPDVFLEDLPGIPPEREIDFGVDLDPNTKPMAIPPYRMAPAELKEFMLQ